jgi:4,5-DOPA dioxygenase extradiol
VSSAAPRARPRLSEYASSHPSDTPHDRALPVWFLAHGSPMLAIQDTPYTRTLATLRSRIPHPSVITVVSAHWQTRGTVCVTAAARPDTIHDFSGFDSSLHEVTYPAPGAPAIAEDIVARLRQAGFDAMADHSRGLDHGVWVPLRWSFPDANVPVVQISLPSPATSSDVLRLGRTLTPLRHRGILLVGSGGMVHNLRTVNLEVDNAPVASWACEFDRWVGARLSEMDIEALAEYQSRGPHAALAVPSPEHFHPLLVTLGAASAGDHVTTLFKGFQYGTLSLRSISLENP